MKHMVFLCACTVDSVSTGSDRDQQHLTETCMGSHTLAIAVKFIANCEKYSQPSQLQLVIGFGGSEVRHYRELFSKITLLLTTHFQFLGCFDKQLIISCP